METKRIVLAVALLLPFSLQAMNKYADVFSAYNNKTELEEARSSFEGSDEEFTSFSKNLIKVNKKKNDEELKKVEHLFSNRHSLDTKFNWNFKEDFFELCNKRSVDKDFKQKLIFGTIGTTAVLGTTGIIAYKNKDKIKNVTNSILENKDVIYTKGSTVIKDGIIICTAVPEFCEDVKKSKKLMDEFKNDKSSFVKDPKKVIETLETGYNIYDNGSKIYESGKQIYEVGKDVINNETVQDVFKENCVIQ